MKNIILCILLLLTTGLCCKDEPTKPKDDPFVSLVIEDASCTEIWLKLSIANITNPVIAIHRGDTNIGTLQLTTTDTTILDKGLLPAQTYTYTAQLINQLTITCSTSARTMDTTSHAWTFTTTLLGDGTGSSCLYDVAIISDSLAYAVGEIYRNDTTFNVAKWDGQKWNLQQLLYQGYPPVIKSIFAITDNNVWFDPWFHWNGQLIQELPVDPVFIGVGVNKLWGSREAGLYAVGNNGLIAHRGSDGVWTKIESGTTTIINDIYGVWNKRTNQYEAYCAVNDFFQPKDKKILRIRNTTAVDSILWNTGYEVSSVWSATGIFLYACGGRIFENSTEVWKETRLGYYTNCIRGSEANCVFVVGDFGVIAHYNGITWQSFFPVSNINSYNRVAVKNNIMIAVGLTINGQAIVTIGKS